MRGHHGRDDVYEPRGHIEERRVASSKAPDRVTWTVVVVVVVVAVDEQNDQSLHCIALPRRKTDPAPTSQPASPALIRMLQKNHRDIQEHVADTDKGKRTTHQSGYPTTREREREREREQTAKQKTGAEPAVVVWNKASRGHLASFLFSSLHPAQANGRKGVEVVW
ncbi:hypothetical protein BKA80DRAFT_18559 [Phyllosticta citrichinensis]